MGKQRSTRMTLRQYQLLYLRFLGQSYHAIGEEMGITASGARTVVTDAARILARCGESAFPEEVMERDKETLPNLQSWVHDTLLHDGKNELRALMDAVDRALEHYCANNVDVVANQETGKYDVIYHSPRNSFAIESGVAQIRKNQTKALIKALNSRHVGYCI